MITLRAATLLLASLVLSVSAWAATTEFTYQGQLRESNAPSNGSYDFTFKLYDAGSGGNQIGPVNQKSGQAVANGVFTVLLDFGDGAFDGSERFLEISVRKAGVGTVTPLAPRQKVTSAPSAVNFTGALSGDVVGGQVGNTVITVGGLPAAQVASGANAANSATSEPAPGFIVLRDPNGNFKVAPPSDPEHAATKQYVDDLETELSAALVDIATQAVAAEAANLNLAIAALQSAVAAATANLNAEIARATGAEATLTANLNAEVAARQAAVAAATASLNNEIARAQAAEATLTANLNAEIARATAAEGTKVSKAGDTMTGLLTLSGNPTANMHAAPKQYVDAETARAMGMEATLTANLNNEIARAQSAEATLATNLNAEITRATAAEGMKVSKAGDTMTGVLTLNGNPTANLHAAPKQYVDTERNRAMSIEQGLRNDLNAEIQVHIQDFESLFWLLGNEAEQRSNMDNFLNVSKISKAGDSMNGFLRLHADPVELFHAATRQYVDLETGRASSAESNLTNAINAERTRAQNAELALGSQIANAASTAALNLEIERALAAEGALQASKVSKAGDTMTGLLKLSGAPTDALHAATKAYVDAEQTRAQQAELNLSDAIDAERTRAENAEIALGNQIANADSTAALNLEIQRALAAEGALQAAKVSKAGDTMTGLLKLSGAPTDALHAATKAYVDAEKARAEQAESNLQSNINAEFTRALMVEGNLQTSIDNEGNARIAGHNALIQAINTESGQRLAADNFLTATKVSKSGDTMNGLLALSGNPTANLHAAPKQYVDAETARAMTAESAIAGDLNAEISARQGAVSTLTTNLNAEIARATAAEGSKVSKSGDTMTGFLTLNVDPTANLHAATKQYVDAETMRATAVENNLMADLSTEVSRATNAEGGLITTINNEITRATNAEATLTNSKVAKSGDTMTGFLTLNADPTANFHAATKQYVDTAGGNKVDKATANIITARHTFNPASASSPFILAANAQNQLVAGLNADQLDGLDSTAFLRTSLDSTLTGNGTAGTPLKVSALGISDGTTITATAANKVQLNMANANTWTGTQTFNGGVAFNGTVVNGVKAAENLRTVRGTILTGGAVIGSGFTRTNNTPGRYTINFTTPFPSNSYTVVVSSEWNPVTPHIIYMFTDGFTVNSFNISTYEVTQAADKTLQYTLVQSNFDFIVTGPQ